MLSLCLCSNVLGCTPMRSYHAMRNPAIFISQFSCGSAKEKPRMISRSSKRSTRERENSPSPPITIQVQVPGSQDGQGDNHCVLPQQGTLVFQYRIYWSFHWLECPVFTGDSVLNGAFKKISNSVSFDSVCICLNLNIIRTIMGSTWCFFSTPWTGHSSVRLK